MYKVEGMIHFIYPIEFYFKSAEDVRHYISIVKTPLNLGQIVSRILEGQYSTLQQIDDDFSILIANCEKYWTAIAKVGKRNKLNQEEQGYIRQARALRDTFMRSLNANLAGVPLMPTIQPSSDSSLSAPINDSPAAAASLPSNSSALAVAPTTSGKETTLKISTSKKKSSAGGGAKFHSPKSSLPVPTAPSAPGWLLRRIVLPVPSQGSVSQRAMSFLKDSCRKCIEEVKKHYIKNPRTNVKVMTVTPFLKAVDPSKYPDYSTIVNVPMDFGTIEKKLGRDKYESFMPVVKDVILIRDNAHAYNVGVAGIEVRIMADQMMNYFVYLVKVVVKEMTAKCSDESVVSTLLTEELKELVAKSDPDDVKLYLDSVREELGSEYTDALDKNSECLVESTSVPSSQASNSPRPSKSSKKDAGNKITQLSLPPAQSQQPSSPLPTTTSTQQPQQLPILPSGNAGSAEHFDTLDMELFSNVPLVPVKTPATIVASKGKGAAKKGTKKKLPSSAVPNQDLGPVVLSPPTTNELSFNYDDFVGDEVPNRVEAEWETRAKNVIKNICKHAYVDYSKPQTAIANFFVSAAQEGEGGMNLAVLQQTLACGAVLDEDDFYEKLLSIFQKVVDHYEPLKEQIVFAKFVKRCRHLVQYTKWLCFENLTMKEDKDKEKPELLGDLRVSVREKEREVREKMLERAPMDTTPAVCKKLLKDLERCRNKQEQYQLSYFLKPVDENLLADYSVYVRRPIDLSTVKAKLEAVSGGQQGSSYSSLSSSSSSNVGRYSTYGEFISDLRRIFSNALKYNDAHRASDHTGLSQLIYDAALVLQARLENLLYGFTLEAVDRIERIRFDKEDEGIKEQEAILKEEKVEHIVKEFESELIEKSKAEDKAFNHDLNKDAKKLESTWQMRQEWLKKRRLKDSQAEVELGMLYDDHDYNEEDMHFNDGRHSNADIVAQWREGMNVPKRFAIHLNTKILLRNRAWEYWSVSAITSSSGAVLRIAATNMNPVNGEQQQHQQQQQQQLQASDTRPSLKRRVDAVSGHNDTSSTSHEAAKASSVAVSSAAFAKGGSTTDGGTTTNLNGSSEAEASRNGLVWKTFSIKQRTSLPLAKKLKTNAFFGIEMD